MPSAIFTDNRFRLDYSVTTVRQEIDNNRSLVRRVLVVVKTGSSYAYSSNTSSWSSSGPDSRSGTFTYNFGNYSSLTLMDRQDWVAHNADGTKSFTSSASVSADTPLGSASIGSFNVTLATIPRATTPNITGGGGFTTGAATTINLPRASSSFTHDVSWSLGTKSGTIATAATTSTSWNPPHTVMTELPNAASGTVEITVVTKNGSTVIGTKKVNFTLTAGAAVVPTISGVAWSDNNTTVATNIGAFVQGASLVKGVVTAAGVQGSSITTKRILLGGQSFAEGTAFLVNGSGTVTAQGEATDSRGRTVTANSSFSVLPYTPPQIGANGWQVRRANSSNVPDDNGEYLRIDLHAIATGLTVGTQKNALTITVRTKASDSGWVNRNTINPGLTHNTAFQVTGGAAYSTTKSYEVEITIVDKTGVPAIVLKTTVGTAVVTLDLNGDKVGVGKMHEFGTLDVAGDIYMSGTKVSVEGHTHNASAINAGTLAAARLPAATESARGTVERATTAEALAAINTSLYVAPAHFRAYGLRRRMVGTASERLAFVPEFGDLWRDTDSSKQIWKGSSDGRWRRAAARVQFSTAGWNGSYGQTWARSESYTFPQMWLENGEDVIALPYGSGNGYELSTMSGRVSNSTAETLNVGWRKISVGAATAQPSYYLVYIVEIESGY